MTPCAELFSLNLVHRICYSCSEALTVAIIVRDLVRSEIRSRIGLRLEMSALLLYFLRRFYTTFVYCVVVILNQTSSPIT